MRSPDIRQLKICAANGVSITPASRILDFGCGDGHRVDQLRALGYPNAFGYERLRFMDRAHDITERLVSEPFSFRGSEDGNLPFEDGLFDLILSDQVFEHVLDQAHAFRECHRVLKPGGVCIHVLPAKWNGIEPHIKVPLGGFKPFKRYAWFYWWALVGVRSPWQHGWKPAKVAAWNLQYSRESLCYLSCRQYRRLLTPVWSLRWEELAYMQTSYKPQIQRLARLAKALPIITSLIRTFHERTLWLQKAGGK